MFAVFSTHNHTGIFTNPTCPTPGAVFTSGGANCIAATARYANVTGSVTTVSGSPGNQTHRVTDDESRSKTQAHTARPVCPSHRGSARWLRNRLLQVALLAVGPVAESESARPALRP